MCYTRTHGRSVKRTEGGKGATTFGSHYIKNIAASGLNQFGVELTQGAISPELDVFADRSVHSVVSNTILLRDFQIAQNTTIATVCAIVGEAAATKHPTKEN